MDSLVITVQAQFFEWNKIKNEINQYEIDFALYDTCNVYIAGLAT